MCNMVVDKKPIISDFVYGCQSSLEDWRLHLDVMPKPDHMAGKKV